MAVLLRGAGAHGRRREVPQAGRDEVAVRLARDRGARGRRAEGPRLLVGHRGRGRGPARGRPLRGVRGLQEQARQGAGLQPQRGGLPREATSEPCEVSVLLQRLRPPALGGRAQRGVLVVPAVPLQEYGPLQLRRGALRSHDLPHRRAPLARVLRGPPGLEELAEGRPRRLRAHGEGRRGQLHAVLAESNRPGGQRQRGDQRQGARGGPRAQRRPEKHRRWPETRLEHDQDYNGGRVPGGLRVRTGSDAAKDRAANRRGDAADRRGEVAGAHHGAARGHLGPEDRQRRP
mmetsp:Transcript_55587/g.146349  ORF Transcript_55587/g.146349 Transcript_55587/m.146349 type:complete len:289 (+) Transcript_55587:715-1581(+)